MLRPEMFQFINAHECFPPKRAILELRFEFCSALRIVKCRSTMLGEMSLRTRHEILHF
jgi:hypothetical protein